MMLEYEEFKEYYLKHKRFPDGQYSNPDKNLNERQIQSKYQKHIRRREKKAEKIGQNSDYMQSIYDAEKNVLENDPTYQSFWSIWTQEEREYLYKKSKIFKDEKGEIIYDPMHVFPRGPNKALADEEANIIFGPRYFHALADQYINPLTEKSMTREEHEQLWRRLVGNERYEYLLSLKRKD